MIKLSNEDVKKLESLNPEEAFKVFASKASELIMRAIADSLQEATSKVNVANVNKDFREFISGIKIDMDWGTPGFKSQPSFLNLFTRPSAEAIKSFGGGFEISVGGTVRF